MDALITTFVAAALAEWGDKTQLIVAALAAARGRPLHVLIGLSAAALASSLVASYAGSLLVDSITIRALSLLVAVALLFGGVAGLMRRRPPSLGSGRMPLILTAAILCLAGEIGDRTQFLTFALAGRFDSAALAAAGATAGIVAAGIPAALLAGRLQTDLPFRAIRYGIAAAFLLAGFVIAVQALQLA